MSLTSALIFLLAASCCAILFAVLKTVWIYKQPIEKEATVRISGYIREGAMAFLSKEYKVLLPFVVLVAIFLTIFNVGFLKFQALSFVLGAFASALAGFVGMRVATATNGRTADAATRGLNPALKVAFSGGSVMGMSVVGLSLLGIGVVMLITVFTVGATADILQNEVMPILTGFSLGASSMALFARVGGGIYTKAADVGADLVGKIEAGLPEDDPRNPATIADNVGDNVGDVAGMGADLFESFVGSFIGCMILGLTASGASELLRIKLVILPILLSGIGIISSMIGILCVRAKEGKSPQRALNIGTFISALLVVAVAFPVIYFFIGKDSYTFGDSSISSGLKIYFAMIIGLASGMAIGFITEYYTGTNKRPVNSIVKACETGSATNLITGMGVGMLSTLAPILIISAAVLGSYYLAGLYGVGIAALGMLSTLGIELAVDAYGPIADNAGGLAVMAEYPSEVREITDSLDAVGNTTAAIGKGFAIGSAALTSIILFSSFKNLAGLAVVDLTSVPVLVGTMIGAMIPYLFSSIAMGAIGRAAFKMIAEVRRQLQELPGILAGTQEPDYKSCVGISTTAALKEMIIPGLIAILTPVLVGFLGGADMLMGLLVGVTGSGVVLAIFMSNSGGAWDNAKKMIETGISGGKGSEAHKASVVGDTVGDPFKDTAGPALNILIKLMAVVALVIAPML
ncbi:MAG: sodium-translocating pyrophosphatase [Spirochaetales bacterium]|nr:sodium-translocating pyrophosphatase [Spirochaetales bacterium]